MIDTEAQHHMSSLFLWQDQADDGKFTLKRCLSWGAWVAQSVKRPTSARSVSSSPTSGSGLMAQSLEPASDSVSPSLSAPPPLI